jgi:hypothetical protein
VQESSPISGPSPFILTVLNRAPELQAHSMINEWLQKQSGIPSPRKSNIADAKRKSIDE